MRLLVSRQHGDEEAADIYMTIPMISSRLLRKQVSKKRFHVACA